MPKLDIGSSDDPFAIGAGSVIAQLKRLRLQSEVQYDIPPMWGPSRLRNEITKTDASGSVGVTEDTGELKLSTGADGSDRVELRTSQYAQYRSGLFGEAAFGIRLSELPSGDQVARWGYFDDQAGFGWGVDAESVFTFYREAGSDTIYRPPAHADDAASEWRLDPLDGTGESGLDLSILDGSVFHTAFRLYGHGPVIQYAEPKDSDAHRAPEVAVDRRVYPTQINLVDFNRQLRAEVENGGTAQNLDLFLAGRQYSLWGDKGVFERRPVPVVSDGYTIGSSGTWEPVLAIRKKPDFPPGTNRGNSVSTRIIEIGGRPTGDAQLKLTLDADVTNGDGDWVTPEDWDDDESAIEVINAETTTPQVSGAQEGLRTEHAFLQGGVFSSRATTERSNIELGAAIEAVLWAYSASGTPDIDVRVEIEEQW